MVRNKHILISAGEASGDIYAADLVKKIRAIEPRTTFCGMGSDLMQRAGVDIVINSNTLSIFGGLEIILKFFKIWSAFHKMKTLLFSNKPDLLVLVDYPGFNLRLAKVAKKAGVKVLYFISPKVWAWHQSRVHIIKKYVDLMAVIFPFEVEFYKQWQIPVVFVGNPLLQMLPKNSLSKIHMRQELELNADIATVGLFPGSRIGEIKRLLPVMLAAAQMLKQHKQNIQFVLSQAHTITMDNLTPYLRLYPELKIQVVVNKNYQVMQACDAIIAASGTATLEIALLEIPQVIIYKMANWEFQIAKRLVKVPYVGLCNILANKKIVPELLQHDANSENISREIETILTNEVYRNKMLSDLKEVRKLLETSEQQELSSLVVQMIDG